MRWMFSFWNKPHHLTECRKTFIDKIILIIAFFYLQRCLYQGGLIGYRKHYTEAYGKHHKMDNNIPFLWCMFLHKLLFNIFLAHHNQNPFRNAVCYFRLYYSQCWRKTCTTFFKFFSGLIPIPKKYVSVCRGLIFT